MGYTPKMHGTAYGNAEPITGRWDQGYYFDGDKDSYNKRNSIYLDFIDLKYNQVGEEVDRISRFIVSKLKEDAGEMVR